VPLTITGSVSASAGGQATADAYISGTNFDGVETCADPSGVLRCIGVTVTGAATLDASYSLPAGAIASVVLSAIGDAGLPGLGSFSASADPMITIDPTFLAQNPGYSLVFSPNLAVPEPASWALMLIGVGGLGAALRASRRSLTAAAA
jgi:hypothetical protein